MRVTEMYIGQELVVTSGEFADHKATVVDPVVPADHLAPPERRRKIEVDIHGAGPGGGMFRTFILPRCLDDPDAPVKVKASRHETADFTIVSRGEIVQASPITDPMDPALDQFRPNASVVKEYVSRNVPGGMTDIEYLLAMRDDRNAEGYSPNVALVGETQSGKTMLVRVLACLAAERDGLPKPYPIFTLNGSMGITSYELFGQPSAVIIDGRETLVWMDGLVPRAINCGAFLYFDEWNAVPPQQATAIHPLLDDRREFTNYQKAVPDGHGGFRPEIVKAHTNTWIIATINPGYKGTQTMAEASTNRFRWLPWDYDNATEEILIPSPTVRMVGEALRRARAERILTVPIGTSALQRFNSDCARYGVTNAVWVFSGMFPPNERARFDAIMVDRGFVDLLRAEYPHASDVTV